jgi:hypothetical protein
MSLFLFSFSSWNLSASLIWRVTDSAHRWYGESPILHINGTESRRFCASKIQRVADSAHRWFGKSPILDIVYMKSRRFCTMLIRRVANSADRWYEELPILQIVDMESRRFCILLIQRVADSAHCWYGEWLTPNIAYTEKFCQLGVSYSRYGESQTPCIIGAGSHSWWSGVNSLSFTITPPHTFKRHFGKNKPGMHFEIQNG